MALKGEYNFKGIAISEAYLQVSSLNCNLYSSSSQDLKTPAVYNSDGTIKTEAVYETTWTKSPSSNASVKVFKDKETRDADPNSQVTEFGFAFTSSLAATAKNHVKQAYEALKLQDKYKDYTDV
tara:strand:+ start:11072 stop:11443 length:372 start_codon:yes stop_codon:yes gene_type:complete